MTNSNNIPTFSEVCGTVTQSLAETIINREAIIAQLRDELRIVQDLLRERCTNYNSLLNTNRDILAQNHDLTKKVAELETEVAELNKEVELDSHISDLTERATKGLRYSLIVAENLKNDLHAQCNTLCTERDEARTERDDARRRYCDLVHSLDDTKPEKIAKSNGWNDLYDSDNTPSLFEQSDVRRTRRSDFTEQRSDSDPVTGVQYGDLV
jgi:chromosome segregation ATPase